MSDFSTRAATDE